MVEAIERGDLDELRGEIGDLIFEGVFLAQLCADAGHFSIVDALNDVRAQAGAATPARLRAATPAPRRGTTPHAVKGKWEEIKAAERAARAVRGEDVRRHPEDAARAAPAPTDRHARRLGRLRLADAQAVLERSTKSSASCARRWPAGDRAHVEEEIGDLLFAVANLARKLGLEPKRRCAPPTASSTRRFAAMQAGLEGRGRRARRRHARSDGSGLAGGQARRTERLAHRDRGARSDSSAAGAQRFRARALSMLLCRPTGSFCNRCPRGGVDSAPARAARDRDDADVRVHAVHARRRLGRSAAGRRRDLDAARARAAVEAAACRRALSRSMGGRRATSRCSRSSSADGRTARPERATRSTSRSTGCGRRRRTGIASASARGRAPSAAPAPRRPPA